jgi:2-iminobutanoate/2-iminopropanoate deaminase
MVHFGGTFVAFFSSSFLESCMQTATRTIVGLFVALLPSLLPAQAPAGGSTGRQVITLPGSNPSSVLSPGIRVGDMLYASGQLGIRRDAPDSTIEGQTRRALENTMAVLEAGGTTMENVVKCTVFLVRASDFGGMNRVYREFFPKDPPARSTVVVAALVSAAAIVEIECMAAMPR